MSRYRFNHRSTFLDQRIMLAMLKGISRYEELEVVAANSTINHHANGMDYLCLHRDPLGETVKLYLIEKPMEVVGNSGFLIHPHTHRYPFSTAVLHGAVEHLRFNARHDKCGDWTEYAYSGDTRRLGKPVDCFIDPVTREFHEVGGKYFVDIDEIHTLRMVDSRPLLLGLVQYPDVDKNSIIYLPEGKNMDFPDSRRPTVEEVIRLRDRCIELIREGK